MYASNSTQDVERISAESYVLDLPRMQAVLSSFVVSNANTYRWFQPPCRRPLPCHMCSTMTFRFLGLPTYVPSWLLATIPAVGATSAELEMQGLEYGWMESATTGIHRDMKQMAGRVRPEA